MKIGFFDSGLGGLLILKAVAQQLPQYDYIFYGDTANLPYGDRTDKEIFALTQVGIEYLFAHDCQLVIIACNTASSEALRQLQDMLLIGKYKDRRILGVIIPTVESVLESGVDRIMLFATKRTVASSKYEREFRKFGNNLVVESKALPELVPLIEGGKIDEAQRLLCSEIHQASKLGFDNFILGCTHYCLLKDGARKELGRGGQVFSQDEIIPPKLVLYLLRHPEIASRLTTFGTVQVFLTKQRADYDLLVPVFF